MNNLMQFLGITGNYAIAKDLYKEQPAITSSGNDVDQQLTNMLPS